VVQELLKQENSLAQLAAVYVVHQTQLIKWSATALEGLPSVFTRQESSAGLTADDEARLATLYEEIGHLTTQVAWFKRQSGFDPLVAGARSAAY
jgi:transposase